MPWKVLEVQERFSSVLWSFDNHQSSFPVMLNLLSAAQERCLTTVLVTPFVHDLHHKIYEKNCTIAAFDDIEHFKVDKNTLIIIDSVEHFLFEHSEADFYSIFKTITRGDAYLHLFLNRNLCPSSFHRRLESLSPAVMRIYHHQRFIDSKQDVQYISKHSGKEYDIVDCNDNLPSRFILESLVRKSSGKFDQDSSIVTMSETMRIDSVQDLESEMVKKEMRQNDEHQVTFNIGLTKEQEESRQNVLLPYMDAQRQEGAKILYSMDLEDDYDDEDPDADLEI